MTYKCLSNKYFLAQESITDLYKKSLQKNRFVFLLFLLTLSTLDASCPATTPWSAPVALSNAGNITSDVFCAATTAGFMATWEDTSNNAHYSFSSNGTSWQTGLITPAQGNVAASTNIFVAGNDTGFVATWTDSSNNAWSSFSSDNGQSWSTAIAINPNTLSLNSTADAYVSGGSSGFVATLIGADNNAYVTFSTGTTSWSTPTQVTSDGSVTNGLVTRQFVAAVVAGNSCMLSWLNSSDITYSAYFSSINPFSSTTPYPIVNVGFLESVPIVAALNGYFMAVARVNESGGQTYFSAATIPSNWATFSVVAPNPSNPDAGPWVAANQTGFMTVWTVSGNPVWTFSTNNGFNFTPVCSILSAPSTTIFAPMGLSANAQGFVVTWLDTNDLNAYASFYTTPTTTYNNIFVTLLQQKYDPLL